LIDPWLRSAGWAVIPFMVDLDPAAYAACAVEEFPTANGPADETGATIVRNLNWP